MRSAQWIVLALACLGSASVRGQAIAPTDLPPAKWVEQFLPEKLPALKHPEYANPLDKALTQMQTGRYRLALQTLSLAKEIDSAQRDLLRAQVLVQTGAFAEAKEILAKQAASAQQGLYLARALSGLGKRSEAIAALKAGLERYPASAELRLELAQALHEVGQEKQAAEALEWFAGQKFLEKWSENGLAEVESAAELTAIAAGLDHLAVSKGLYQENASLHQAILSMFIRSHDVLQREDVDSRVRAAEFFLNHDDSEAAQERLESALARNPNHVQANRLMGEIALAEFDFDSCEAAIAAIARVNPEHPDGAALMAEMLLMERQPEEARQIVRRQLAADSGSAQWWALAAACEALRFDASALQQQLQECDRRMPESAQAYAMAAQFLMPAFQFRKAAELSEVAIARAPHWNQARNALALSLMQLADVEKARPVLEQAHKLDSFNVQTTNYLRLLDSLGEFKVVESAHFAVRYSPKEDPFLAGEVLRFMEGNYWRICSEFGHEPKERTFIELMPTAQDFAVRTTGKPWLATVGASTGPVITLVAPRPSGKTMGVFDWTDVTRHEYVHTVTLGATDQRIPRWFTEGLAVAEQTAPLNSQRYHLLASAVKRGGLTPIKRLNWAFIRPKKRGGVSLAYSQSYWMCCFIQEQFGHAGVLALMHGYGDGLTTEAAVQRAFKVSSAEFDQRFTDWARAKVKALGLDEAGAEQARQLKEQGEELIKQQKWAEALAAYQQAYQKCKVDPVTNQRLAGLYLHPKVNRPEQAIPHLQALDAEQLKNNGYALRLAALFEGRGELATACASARRATYIAPYDVKAREVLARLLEKTGDLAGAGEQRKILQTLNSNRRDTAATND